MRPLDITKRLVGIGKIRGRLYDALFLGEIVPELFVIFPPIDLRWIAEVNAPDLV